MGDMGMNLDELERLHKEATPGEWRSFKRTTYFHLKTAGGGVYVAEPISGRMNFRHGHDTRYIAALHNAFPDLLALARDGERYREAAKGVWVLTREVNAYDQEGEYFVAVFTSKPTAKQLSKYGVPAYRIESVLCNKGRIDNDDAWHFLRFEQDAAIDAARKGEKP